MDTIGKRLKAARELRKLSQQDFAELGGVQKRAQINYEQDLRAPDAAYLSALAAAGVDVLHVLTGEHPEPIAPTFEGRLGALQDITKILERHGLKGAELTEILYILRVASAPRVLSQEQEKLLSSYNNCSPEDQAAIRRLADAAAQPKQVTRTPGPKYRPKPTGPDQPSVHDKPGTYAIGRKKPSEAG